MKRLVSLAVMALAPQIVLAQGTITDAPATFVVTDFDTSPSANFTGVSATLAQDHLFEQGFWFRIEGDAAETILGAPDGGTQVYSGNVATMSWANVGGRGFAAAQRITVWNGGGPSGFAEMKLTLTNSSATNPLRIHVFHMADIDLAGAGSDSATLVAGTSHIAVTDPSGNRAEYRAPGASAFLVRPFGATDVGAVLSDAAVTNFDNTGLPFGPGDFTAGFQWNPVVIPPGRSQTFRALLAVNQGAPAPDLPRVAVISGPFTAELVSDQAAKLLASGSFSAVGGYNLADGIPGLAQLRQYDAVLVAPDSIPFDQVTLGNNLADYVDGGGGVVAAMFSMASAAIRILGRFDTDNYWAIQPTGQQQGTAAGLGTVYVPGHPILAGVNAFSGGTASYRPSSSSLHPQATRVADWTGAGTIPLVATRVINGVRRADLGMYPGSSDALTGAWTSTTDGARLMANALLWTIGRLPEVAVMGSPATASWNNDVQANLMASGSFSGVDLYNIQAATPQLGTMQLYDALLVFTDAAPLNNPVFGDNLANYVDAGGGVVTGMFAMAGPTIRILGRFDADNYWAIQPTGQGVGAEGLGVISARNHPILAGATSFAGGSSSYRPSTNSLHPQATRVADWTGAGTIPLIATRFRNGRDRADLAFYPPSSAARADFWTASTDGARFLANALVWVHDRIFRGDFEN